MSVSITPSEGNDTDKPEKTYSPFLGAKISNEIKENEETQEIITEIQEKQDEKE